MFKMDSRAGLLEREQEVMRILNLFLEEKLDFVVVGGYAISTYKKRFSIDLDIVVKEENLDKFEKINKKVKKDGKKENEQSTGYCSQEPVNCRWSEYD